MQIRYYSTRLLKDVYCRFLDDEVTALGAQMTYYLILSFFPFFIFLFTLTAYTPLNREDMAADIVAILPPGSQTVARGLLGQLIREKNQALLSVGMAGAIWASSSGMMAIFRALNKAYDEEEHRPYWKVRLMAIVYTFGFAAAVWLSFVLLVFGRLIGQLAFQTLALPNDFEQWWIPLKYVLSLIIMCVIFSLFYYRAPSRRMKYRETLPGAVFATLGWIAASSLFSIYVNRADVYKTTYGSLGGIIALLIWLYASSIILLIGGELNASLSFKREGKIKTECKAFGFRLPFFRITKN